MSMSWEVACGLDKHNPVGDKEDGIKAQLAIIIGRAQIGQRSGIINEIYDAREKLSDKIDAQQGNGTPN